MKITLEFDDMEEAKTAMDGCRYKSALWDLDQHLRSRIKYEELTDEAHSALESTRAKLHELAPEGLNQ
jgi:hypothetical protein